jgi:histidine phosphotransferase ChpT
MSKLIDFTEALMTKMCHDLSGSIGAAHNGIELLETTKGKVNEDLIKLLMATSSEVVAKFRFFRCIYGTASNKGEANLESARRLIEDLLAETKTELYWSTQDSSNNITLLPTEARLLLNMVMIAKEALLQGGKISIISSLQHKMDGPSGNKRLLVVAEGESVKVKDDVDMILTSHELRDLSLTNVQIHWTAKLASELGTIVQNRITSSRLELSVELGEKTA